MGAFGGPADVAGFVVGEASGLVVVTMGLAAEFGGGAAVASLEDVGAEDADVFEYLGTAYYGAWTSGVIRHDVPCPPGYCFWP